MIPYRTMIPRPDPMKPRGPWGTSREGSWTVLTWTRFLLFPPVITRCPACNEHFCPHTTVVSFYYLGCVVIGAALSLVALLVTLSRCN